MASFEVQTNSQSVNSSNNCGEISNGEEVQSLWKWERYKFNKKEKLPKLAVNLNPLRVNEIQVDCSSPSFRTITYFGCEDSFETSGNRTRNQRIREWRIEVITALPRKEGFGVSQGGKSVVLPIASEYPSIFFVETYKDDVHSILDVLTGQKMSTFVLDAYLTRRIRSYNEQRSAGDLFAVYIPILFFPALDRGQDLGNVSPNAVYFPHTVLRGLKDCLLVAPLYIYTHFYLAMFYLNSREIRIYDSSWKFQPVELRMLQVRKIANYISKIHGSSYESWNITLVQRCAQQQDECSCGCYVIYFVENELKGTFKNCEKRMTSSEIKKVRNEIVTELLTTSTVGMNLLNAIML